MFVSVWLYTTKPQLSAAKPWYSHMDRYKVVDIYALIHVCYFKPQAVVAHAHKYVYNMYFLSFIFVAHVVFMCTDILACFLYMVIILAMPSCACLQVYIFSFVLVILIMCMHTCHNRIHTHACFQSYALKCLHTCS